MDFARTTHCISHFLTHVRAVCVGAHGFMQYKFMSCREICCHCSLSKLFSGNIVGNLYSQSAMRGKRETLEMCDIKLANHDYGRDFEDKMDSPGIHTQLDLGHVVEGVQRSVRTRYGPITVTIYGNPEGTPCITYHDVGLNHRSCFQSLLVCSSALLLNNFCIYQIDAPGSEDRSLGVPSEMFPMTVDKLADQVKEVIAFFDLKEPVGLGVGAGGYILAHYAAQNVGKMAGLVLVSPACQAPGWWEWTAGKAALYRLQWRGLSDAVKDHLLSRLGISSDGSQDLIATFKQDMSYRHPEGISQFLSAMLQRPDISEDFKKLDCRVLLLSGESALYRSDCLHINTVIDHSHSAWLEIEQCGGLATEEKPHSLLSPIRLFLTALQQTGFGMNWDLR